MVLSTLNWENLFNSLLDASFPVPSDVANALTLDFADPDPEALENTHSVSFSI